MMFTEYWSVPPERQAVCVNNHVHRKYAMMTAMKRRRAYTKVARAAAEEATRGRIVSAIMALHEEIGPARTTVSAVADRAGVERLTVYRHFPDETSMLRACSAHWSALNPLPPIPDDGTDPVAAFRRTLVRLYGWYRANAAILAQIRNDTHRIPILAELIAPLDSALDRAAAELDAKWPRRNAPRATTIRHALEFSTWRSLDRLTGSDRRAAALAVAWISE
jgi:AcrR family transcriptional regulator